MIDFSLTQEQQMLQSLARDFAQNKIGPIVQIIEESNNLEMEPWDFCKQMFYRTHLTSKKVQQAS